jgi:hypothetical protein
MRLVRIVSSCTLAAWFAIAGVHASRADAVKSWSAVPSDRYESLSGFNDEAFLDKDTGLVWRKSIDFNYEGSSADAARSCAETFVGGKGGWRLPKFEEIHSLLESSGGVVVTTAPFTNYECNGFYYFGGGWINTCTGTVTSPDIGQDDILCVRGGTN